MIDNRSLSPCQHDRPVDRNNIMRHAEDPDLRVLLVGNGRSGSSFVGGLFNRAPGFFYLFEPLMRHTGTTVNLTDLLECTFRVHSQPIVGQLQCYRSGSCRGGGSVSRAALAASCLSRRHRALKLVRLVDAAPLFSAAQSLPANARLHVIHLVRDPRAVLFSMASAKDFQRLFALPKSAEKLWQRPDILRRVAATICARSANLHRAAALNGEGHPQARYALLRYEDVALAPAKLALALWQFVQGFARSVRAGSRLGQHARGAHRNVTRLPAELSRYLALNTGAAVAPSSERSYYSIARRNPGAHVDEWWRHMPRPACLVVTAACASTLQLFSYPPSCPAPRGPRPLKAGGSECTNTKADGWCSDKKEDGKCSKKEVAKKCAKTCGKCT